VPSFFLQPPNQEAGLKKTQVLDSSRFMSIPQPLEWAGTQDQSGHYMAVILASVRGATYGGESQMSLEDRPEGGTNTFCGDPP
jgi:hypothetical protein